MFGADPKPLGDTSVPLSFPAAAECPSLLCVCKPTASHSCVAWGLQTLSFGNSGVQDPAIWHPTQESFQSAATSPETWALLVLSLPTSFPLPSWSPYRQLLKQFQGNRAAGAKRTSLQTSPEEMSLRASLGAWNGGRGRQKMKNKACISTHYPARLLTACPRNKPQANSMTKAKLAGDRRPEHGLALSSTFSFRTPAGPSICCWDLQMTKDEWVFLGSQNSGSSARSWTQSLGQEPEETLWEEMGVEGPNVSPEEEEGTIRLGRVTMVW